MIRLSASSRLAGTALAVVAVAGIGFGAYRLGSAAGARTEAPLVAAATSSAPASSSPAASSSSSSAPSSAPSSASDAPTSPSGPPAAAPVRPLTLDQAKAVAFRAAGGGRVVEASEDAEPTGLLFDITVLHPNGSATKLEIEAATGRVVSLEQDDHWD
jgi:cytoskeletal protein RodZ